MNPWDSSCSSLFPRNDTVTAGCSVWVSSQACTFLTTSSGSTPSEGRPSQELIIQVPQGNVEKVGIRDVIDKKGVKQVFDVLRAEFVEEPTNWSRRFKANQEKLASGDVVKVSENVRDLWRRDQDRGLSAGEKRMLAKARQILVSELALARQVDEEKASAELDKVLAS
ncbi:MAG: CarD family transcriptional regulator [Aquiluna sp.]